MSFPTVNANCQPPVMFLRLAQTMVSWISTPTAEGTLYDVDLRLRPEGQAGAVATSIDRLPHILAVMHGFGGKTSPDKGKTDCRRYWPK